MSAASERLIDYTLEQDEPTVEHIEREQRAKAGKPEYLDLTADELNRIATKEWREQGALRGPIIVPEWQNAGIFCRRLSYSEQVELLKIHGEKGLIGAFCFRALNSKGERIFESMKMFEDAMQNRWNYAVIDRVITAMAGLCKTQLSDAELGNS